MKSIKTIAAIGAAVIGVAACTTAEQALTEAGAVRLTQAEVQALVSGKTQEWSKGGAYYAPDGTLDYVWDGARATGSYVVEEDGCLDWRVESWGDTQCTYFFNDNGAIVSLYKGKTEPTDGDWTEGNQVEQYI